MATTSEKTSAPAGFSRRDAGVSDSAKAWMIVGGLWLALMIYTLTAWVTGPNFVTNTFGREAAPQWYRSFVQSIELGSIVLTVILFWVFFLKPFLRDRRLGFDALFLLAVAACVFQEPWLNGVRPSFFYSTLFINYGSWMGDLPGIVSPTAQKVPFPILSWTMSYLYIVAFPAWCGSRVMSWARARNPGLSNLKLVGVCFLFIFAFDFAVELACTRLGIIAYQSTIPELTLFAGKTYQIPMYEFLHWCGTYTAWSCIHFFRNDKGESFADRGIALMALPRAGATFLRWLALMGMCQMTMLVIYNIPFSFWAMHGGAPVISEAEQPWMTAQLCGESTPYDCSGPGVPIARHDTPTNRLGGGAAR